MRKSECNGLWLPCRTIYFLALSSAGFLATTLSKRSFVYPAPIATFGECAGSGHAVLLPVNVSDRQMVRPFALGLPNAQLLLRGQVYA